MTKDNIQKHLKEHLRLCRQRMEMGRCESKEQKAYYNGKIDGIIIALSEIGELSTETKTQCKITASVD